MRARTTLRYAPVGSSTDSPLASYVLLGTTPRLAPTMLALIWLNSAPRTLAATRIHGVLVSTVFLTFDHGFGSGRRALFETMLFLPNGTPGDCRRYTTWADAMRGHQVVVEEARTRVHGANAKAYGVRVPTGDYKS